MNAPNRLSPLFTHNLGFPRIGARRELKKAVEAYWKGKSDAASLEATASTLRRTHWQLQKEAGIQLIPSNDFSLYDQVLDMSCLLGNVPQRFAWDQTKEVDLDTCFAIARGSRPAQADTCCASKEHEGAFASEMTKWFDTNYHFIVPEFNEQTTFKVASRKPFAEFTEALELGIRTKPVLLGPVSYLFLGKVQGAKNSNFDRFSLLSDLLPVYGEILKRLADQGAEWVQLDEPIFALDLDAEIKGYLQEAYTSLAKAAPKLKLLVATYFGNVGQNLMSLISLPAQGFHLDLTRGAPDLDMALSLLKRDAILSLGVVDGRNVWRNHYENTVNTVHRALEKIEPERLWLAPSCSLLHVPNSLQFESKISPTIKSWMAYAQEKLHEVSTLARLARCDNPEHDPAWIGNRAIHASRAESPMLHRADMRQRLVKINTEANLQRGPFAIRQRAQRERLKLPSFPTTTIGSFPQTEEVRSWRARWRKGDISDEHYELLLEDETIRCIREQELYGIDVLVHGEFERNDMVEFFGEQLDGFVFSENGWVQSYGSRCVKPPIIFGDVLRPKPMTVRWFEFSQRQTKLPMKGMLTGPVTILQWSFVRDDIARSKVCQQIALAIRDEVQDLEAAGAAVIQIDEPAIREGLPLRKRDQASYLKWAVDCFRLAAAVVRDDTQIHTHMCYSEFNDIMDSISAMDADVITIETSRSNMELLDAFVDFQYPREIGPGVYDIHSPRIPREEEMERLMQSAINVLPADNLWVNPDCGLKTRRWEEVTPSLINMVNVARKLRANYGEQLTSADRSVPVKAS